MIKFCFLFWFIPAIGFSQITDNFADGNFTENPCWLGDATNFEVNTALQLHLRSASSDTSVLFTRSECTTDTEWNFWLKLSFNTSANNYARVYLSVDTFDLTTARGYFVQTGGADDSLFIIRQHGDTLVKIYRFESFRMIHNTNTLRIKIKRDAPGNWEVSVDTTGGTNYFSEGTFFDNTFSASHWFGVYCRYTSSNATKFYFDDFYVGPIIHDTVAPTVTGLDIFGEKIIRITFSEIIPKENAENIAHYRLAFSGQIPDSAMQNKQQPSIVDLVFTEAFPDNSLDSLLIQDIADLSGNFLTDTLVPVSFYRAKAYDVVINEILADPDPTVGLPDGEFIELFNRTPFPINLNGWSLKFGSYIKTFPSVFIQPHNYILVAKDSLYSNFAACVILFTSSFSLSNEGTSLVLKDIKQQIIHSVTYNSDWFRGSFKSEGGWSLEMIDTSNPCGCDENWEASKHISGGTPGKANSVQKPNPDENIPYIKKVVLLDSNLIQVFFSETIDSSTVCSAKCWEIIADPVGAESVQFQDPGYKSVRLHFPEEFEAQRIYVLKTHCPIKDCVGNQSDTNQTVKFAIPELVEEHEIVINEILSNPVTGGSRFVELYNRSEKVTDLKMLVISRQDTVEGFLPGAIPLSVEGHLLFPGDHVALTASPDNIIENYYSPTPDAIIQMPDLPAFEEDSGTIILARKDNLMVIDKIHYCPEMHYPLLATREGVSLERLSPDRPSFDETNWHSAAETVGFATPAYRNSHGSESNITDDEIKVNPELFSPDNDGQDDFVNIEFNDKAPNTAASITIYDSRGRMVVVLANNILLSSQEIFSWNGLASNHGKAPMGNYIIFIELTNPNGSVVHKKAAVFLCGKP